MIRQQHLDDALAELRPSVTAEDRRRYETVYERFEQRDAGPAAVPQQRITLA